jgi:hypothetical protein
MLPPKRHYELELRAVTERHRIEDENITISMLLGQEGGEPGTRYFTTRASPRAYFCTGARGKRRAFDDMTMSMSFYRGIQKSRKSNTKTEILYREPQKPTQEHRHSMPLHKAYGIRLSKMSASPEHSAQLVQGFTAPRSQHHPGIVFLKECGTRHSKFSASPRTQHNLSQLVQGSTEPISHHRPSIVFIKEYGSIKCAASQTGFGTAERWQFGRHDWTRLYGLPDTGLLFWHRTRKSGGVSRFIEFSLSMSIPLTTRYTSFGAVHTSSYPT